MLTRPANSNTRAGEAHSHDEVGFAREWSRAEQDEYARRRVQAMEEASRDPGLRKDIEELKERCRAAPRPEHNWVHKLNDDEFDLYHARLRYASGDEIDPDYRNDSNINGR